VCSHLHNSLQEEICLNGVLLAKNQNLSNQLDSLKDTKSRLIDYVKSINKKVGTADSGKEFSEVTENNKSRKIKEFKSKAETALWFVESYGIVHSSDNIAIICTLLPKAIRSLPVNFLFNNKTLIFLLESLFSCLSVNFN
jgi:hypothetical protein